MFKSAKNNQAGDESFVYEEAIARIESIIDRIESGEAGLEETIQQCEAGLKLIGRCRSVLDTAEKRIAELTAEGGELHVEGEIEGEEEAAEERG